MVSANVAAPPPDAGLTFRRPLGGAPFYSIYECADGKWLHFGCLVPHFQVRAMKAISLEEELRALGFGEGRAAPAETRAQIFELITARMKEKTFAEWSAIFEEHDVPHAPSQWTEDLLDDPQVRHEGLVIEIEDPVAGLMEQMGPTVLFEDTSSSPPSPTPLAGEHTDAICAELGLSASEIESLRTLGAIR
jgi:crotonobetainyl-CoA:carnitine CoA-transferase CaiB-like acyl-CoA transferase